MPTNTPMIAITTNNSINVKPGLARIPCLFYEESRFRSSEPSGLHEQFQHGSDRFMLQEKRHEVGFDWLGNLGFRLLHGYLSR